MGYLYLLLTALPLLLLLLTSPPLPVKLLLLWLMMAYGVVMCGFFSFLGVSERVLGKRRDGVIPLWSLFLFSPWFFGVNLVWYLSNFYHNFFENVSDEVFEGWLGSLLFYCPLECGCFMIVCISVFALILFLCLQYLCLAHVLFILFILIQSLFL